MQYHEPYDKLPDAIKDQTRAINSLREELEAIDWYDQRAAIVNDQELKKILEHNRDEEKEHAAMLIEWLRKHDKEFDRQFSEHDQV
ncbi:MAG: ferritin [Candidatus Komeilibacteria bacterium]